MLVAKYMNWWPARPVMAGAIARRVSFQIDLAWNFLEAHHESNLKARLSRCFRRYGCGVSQRVVKGAALKAQQPRRRQHVFLMLRSRLRAPSPIRRRHRDMYAAVQGMSAVFCRTFMRFSWLPLPLPELVSK